jgi:hypothetical protein
MTFEEMQTLVERILQAQLQAQVEMAEIRAQQAITEKNLAKTEAIANSNARAILANTEADRIHRQASAELNAKLDRLADLVERYIIASQIRQDAIDIRLEGLANRVSDLENE